MDLSLLFPLLILVLFIPIFLSGRRQRRQVQEMKDLQAALEPGDVVVTTSGLRGTVVDASYEDTIDIEIADGVVTTWVRAAVREKVAPTAVVDAPADDTIAVDNHAVDNHIADTPATGTPATGTAATGPVAEPAALERDDRPSGSSKQD